METQDHKKANHSGHEGHSGGVHICHKCGWPFPNPHPSARHRRAHKRVCGTLEGYSLDNNNNTISDGEHGSDDDNKTPSSNVVERNISRKGSSGVGSRSSRSTRSEDEVFADAVTEFVESPGSQEVSYGVISRGSSLQNTVENKLEMLQLEEENEVADNLSTSAILPGDKELPTAKAIEGENNKVEASLLPHDHISSSSNNLEDSDLEEHKEDASCKELMEQRILCSETAKEALEDICASRGVSEEFLDSVTVSGNVELKGNQTTEFKDKVECAHDVDSSGNLQAPVHSVQVVEPADGTAGKVGDMFEECDSRTEANGNVYVPAVADALHLEDNSNIAVDDVDHEGVQFNISEASDATVGVGSVEFGQTPAIEESCSSTGFADPGGESNFVCSVDDVPKIVHSTDNFLNPELGQNESIVDQNTVEEPVQTSDVKASDADATEFGSKDVLEDLKKESCKNQEFSSHIEQIVSSENVSPKGVTTDGGDDQEITANEVANTSRDFKPDEKDFIVDDKSSKVPVGELAVTSPVHAEPAVNDFAIQAEELTSDQDRNNVGYDEKVKVEDTALNGNEVRSGGEEAIEPMEAKTAPDSGLTIAGYSDKDELFELEKKHDQGELDKNLVSGNVMVGHAPSDSLPTSLGDREIQTVEGNVGEVESKTVDNAGAFEKPDDHTDSGLKISEDAGSSCPSSDVVAAGSIERAANNEPSVIEGDKITKQHASVSVADMEDSSSQTESLEGNWGSVSVLSAVSDASPATDMAASKAPQALAEEVTVSLEPKVREEGHQHSVDKTLTEPQPQPQVTIEESPGASEIQVPRALQQQSSAGGSPIVAHVANDRLGGKTEEEIIAKVNDWDSGKQHTALKTLLGEASAWSRAESPNHDDDSVSVPQANETPRTNNRLSSKTENVTLVSEDPKTEAAKEEIGKEWNSPARYPVNIKTEKRRAKSRPYWVPFLCCSSVNAR